MTNDDTKELTLCRFYVALGGKVEGIGRCGIHSSSHFQAGITSICLPLSNGTVPSSS